MFLYILALVAVLAYGGGILLLASAQSYPDIPEWNIRWLAAVLAWPFVILPCYVVLWIYDIVRALVRRFRRRR